MTYRVEVTTEARRELLDHYEYIGRDNPSAAERFYDAAEATMEFLAEWPGLGRRWESSRTEVTNVRLKSIRGFRNYLIFYSPIENGIRVLHVFHGAQDIRSRLEPEGR